MHTFKETCGWFGDINSNSLCHQDLQKVLGVLVGLRDLEDPKKTKLSQQTTNMPGYLKNMLRYNTLLLSTFFGFTFDNILTAGPWGPGGPSISMPLKKQTHCLIPQMLPCETIVLQNSS